ncbi:hypothetical protein [Dactylosporangium salmoneum]|uniref:Uncharacterized protein n=1 Tax=Dactylosporangium salmoneum TaxID=53361 RepID=A0ABP5SCN2_9ACTN
MATPAQRELAASIGSLTRWSRVHGDEARRAALAPARRGLRAKWEQEADPDGRLSPAELDAAVERLKQAHYRRMALASSKARGSKRAAA